MQAEIEARRPARTRPARGPVTLPRTIRLSADDNVAIVVNAFGLPAGTVFPDGLELVEFVPQGHKVALSDIAEGGAVRRYGEVVGIATQAIPRGAWVEESRVATPVAPALDALELATRVPAPLPPLEGYTFAGYRNPDGSVGTKNILAISISVQCVAGTLDVAIRRIKQELLPRFPNVDDVVGLTHAYGCGVAINAPEAVVPIRTLQSLAQNPNFGGEVMVVGLGCEKLVSERLLPDGGAAGDGVVRLQDERHRGFSAMLDSIMAMAETRLEVLNRRTRETCPASELVVGLQCGGSDAFSGVTANPALGYCADLIVACGGTVLFSEVTEVRDAIHLLTPRAKNPEVAQALIREMAWYDAYLAKGEADRRANPSPGNKKGGLNNIVEKALGSVAKSGTERDRRGAGAGRARPREGPDLRRDPGQRLRLRHAPARLGDHPAGVLHRPRHALRSRSGPGDQGRHPDGAGRALVRPDRPRCRPHRHRRGHDRAGRLGAVPPDPRRGERAQAALVRPLGPVQRSDPVQPGADHLSPGMRGAAS